MELTLKVRQGRYIHPFDVKLRITEDRIWFQRMPFSKILNVEIKAMRGWHWHGHDDPPLKKWSVDNCQRNVLQIKAMSGENVYEWFERPLVDLTEEDFTRPAFARLGRKIEPQQLDMIRRGLTYHYQILAAEQGLGKSLAAIEIMERSGHKECWYIGPKSGLASVERELILWEMNPEIHLSLMTYEKLVSTMRFDFDGLKAPGVLILDESDYLKNPTTHRAKAAQAVADMIREQHGMDGYVIELSGTPSAKLPTDLWSQCEIAWPGYLREGNFRAFEERYRIMEKAENLEGTTYTKKGPFIEEEVAKLPNRYAGLMTVYRKQDWVDLPPKKYRTVRLTPSKKVLRVAKSLCNVAPNTMTALTWMRALSSGFQYINQCTGEKDCPVCKGTGEYEFSSDQTFNVCDCCSGRGKVKEYDRVTKMVHTPKDDALREEMDKCDIHGRIVIAASFQGSIDRVLKICKERGWAVACVDGRGWRSYDAMGNSIDTKPLDLWDEHHGKVAFVGNPGSCRYGLTLTAAHTLVFYDNSFSAVQRLQMEDRVHRLSMDLLAGALIVDLIHLEVDQLVIDTLKANKELELLSLGAIAEAIGLDEDDSICDDDALHPLDELLEEVA